MKNRDTYGRRYKIQEILYLGQWRLSPLQSRHLGPHTVLPIAINCPIVFFLNLLTVWNLSPFKGDFSFGKSQKSQDMKSELYGGWVTWVIWCFIQKRGTRRDVWVGMLPWWSCQSPVPCICRLLNHLSRFCRGMLKLNAKFVTDLLLYLLSHFECNGHIVHMLTLQPCWLV